MDIYSGQHHAALAGIPLRSEVVPNRIAQACIHIERPSWIWNALVWLVPFAFIALIYGVGMRRIAQVKGPLTFGQNQAKIYDQSSRVQVPLRMELRWTKPSWSWKRLSTSCASLRNIRDSVIWAGGIW
jgi:hypothetical protein